MTQLLVNGVEKPLPEATSFGELLEHVRENYVTEQSWITSVHLDGKELMNWDESEHQGLSATGISSVEVSLARPQDIALETIQTLVQFTDHLIRYGQETADALRAGNAAQAQEDLQHLIENLRTFSDSLNGVKQTLGAEACQETAILEIDLLSILGDTLDFYKEGQYTYVAEMLSGHLASNLTEWRDDGLPALARAAAQ